MKTIIIIYTVLLSSVLCNAQITVNEKAIKNNNPQTVPATPLSYNFNLKSFTTNAKETTKALVTKKLGELQVDTTKESVALTEEQKEALTSVTKEVENEISYDETTIIKNPFYYEYFSNRLEKTEEEYDDLLKKKKEFQSDLKKLNELETKINAAKSEVKRYKDILRDLEDITDKNNSTEKGKQFLPSRKRDNREEFFELLYSKDEGKNNYVLNNVSAQIGSNSAAVTSELLASYIKFARISFGTLISNADNDNTENPAPAGKAEGDVSTDETDAFQRLLSSGGGNLYLNLEVPLFYKQTGITMMYFNFNARGGLVLDQFSDDVDTSTGNGNAGFNFYGSLSTDDKKSFIFFVNANFGGYSGGTDFYEKLNLSENKLFAFGQATVGVDISKSLRISYTVGTVGSDDNLRSKRGVVGIQLLKSLFGNK
jgi:hypothetical protein